MAIREFTAEERAAAKAKAVADFQGECLEVHLTDPINESLILAPFDRKSYSSYSDAEDADPQSAYSEALMGRLIFPDLVPLNDMCQRWPALAEDAAAALRKEAGTLDPMAACELLNVAALPAGLTLADAQRIIGEAKGRNLWAFTMKDQSFAVVIATPDPYTWIAARAAHDDAARKGKGRLDAVDPYVQAACVWSSAPLTGGNGILDRRPALAWLLWNSYKRAGGEGAKARTFRF